jgi:hypothetical protein
MSCIDVEQMFYNKRSEIRGDVWRSPTDRSTTFSHHPSDGWGLGSGVVL